MARKQLPGFIFYPDDYYGSETVQCMSWEAQGLYMWLLSQQSRQGSIPADLGRLARMARMDRDDFEAIWSEQIAPCFEPTPDDPDRLHNPKLTEVLAERDAKAAQAAAAGSKGGRASQGKPPSSGSEADAQATLKRIGSGRSSDARPSKPIQSNPIQAPTEQFAEPPTAVAPMELSLAAAGFGKAARQRTIAADRLRAWGFTDTDVADWCAHTAAQAPRINPGKILGWTLQEKPRVEKAVGAARKWRDERAGPGAVLQFKVREA